MRAFFNSSSFQRLSNVLCQWDAQLEHKLIALAERMTERLRHIRRISDAFEPSPLGKLTVFLCCEILTYTAIGGIVMVALAKPAFQLVAHENWLKQQDLSITFLDVRGKVLGHRGIVNSEALPLEHVPSHLIHAALATEDRRFFDHNGIDPQGLIRAILANSRGQGVVQGGSTITQQLAKNLFLSAERSLDRKIKEAFLALWLEARLSKQEILKLYLDRAYLGRGVFGVQSAAIYYFGKDVRDLSLAEAAMIAGLFKAPSKFSPLINLSSAQERSAEVLSNMVEARFLTQGQIIAALRNPATPIERTQESMAEFALDYGFDEVKKLAASGKLGGNRVVTVHTGIDATFQEHAEATVEEILKTHGKSYDVSQSAVVVLDHSGLVKAMVGGRDYEQSQFNRAVQAMRPPGSSFKPFIYAAALAEGVIKPSTIVVDKPTCVGNWCPSNYGRSFAGSMPATVALAKSVNTVPVQLSGMIAKGNHKLGRQKVIALTKSLGFQNELRDVTALPIGASEVNVVDMATGFNTFANGGKAAPAHIAHYITNGGGDIIYTATPLTERPQALPLKVAADLNFMLSKVVTEGTGRKAMLPGIPSAGKTGTTDEYRNAWYIGYTGTFTTAVWMGNDDYSPTNNMTGGSLPAMAFAKIMAYLHLNTELKPLIGLPEDSPYRDSKLAEIAGDYSGQKYKNKASAPVSTSGSTLVKEGAEHADERAATSQYKKPIPGVSSLPNHPPLSPRG